MNYGKLEISVVIQYMDRKLSEKFVPELQIYCLEWEQIMKSFVEDSGPDDAWEIIKEISLSDLRVKGYKLSKNFGQHNAFYVEFAIQRGN